MALFWVRTGNNGADAAFTIDDLGITIPTGAGWTVLSEGDSGDPSVDGYGQFTARELRDSNDLHDAIIAGSLEFSLDGLSESLQTYISDVHLTLDFKDDFFDLSDGRLRLPNEVQPPTSIPVPKPGDIFYDTDDGYLVFYSGVTNSWVTISDGGVATDHGSLSGLLDDDHTQYSLLAGDSTRNAITGEFDFSGGELLLPKAADPLTSYPGAVSGNVAYDTDDGYMVFYDGTKWVQVIDTDTIGNFSNLIDHGQLQGLGDDDHLQYGLLTGNAARNTVTGTYDFRDGYLITPTYPSAPAAQADGEISYINGVLYAYDAVRAKWLSVDRQVIVVSKRGNANDVYLRLGDGVATSETGVRALRNGTITGITAQTDTSATWVAEVHTGNALITGASLTVTAATGDQDGAINADFSQGDELQVFANTTGNIKAPVVFVEIAWRA